MAFSEVPVEGEGESVEGEGEPVEGEGEPVEGEGEPVEGEGEPVEGEGEPVEGEGEPVEGEGEHIEGEGEPVEGEGEPIEGEGEPIEGEGEPVDLCNPDLTAPVIRMNGESEITVNAALHLLILVQRLLIIVKAILLLPLLHQVNWMKRYPVCISLHTKHRTALAMWTAFRELLPCRTQKRRCCVCMDKM